VFWSNPDYGMKNDLETLNVDDINDASKRLDRFAPYIAKVFPETAESNVH
jgi:D-serine dehydratase